MSDAKTLTADDYAKILARLRITTFANMQDSDRVSCVGTVLSDLEQLAQKDGCVAAAVALEMLMAVAELHCYRTA